MPHSDDNDRAPVHPIRESVGFFAAAAAALGGLFWPHRRRTLAGDETVIGDAEPVHLALKEKASCVAPFPVND